MNYIGVRANNKTKPYDDRLCESIANSESSMQWNTIIAVFRAGSVFTEMFGWIIN